MAGFFDSSAIKTTDFAYWNGLRAAQQLQNLGRREDSRWIINFLAATMPKRFKRGKTTIQVGHKVVAHRQVTERERTLLPNGDFMSHTEIGKPLHRLGGT